MIYTFSGQLCGYLCAQCPEALSGVSVRLYRTQGDENVTRLAVADPKETLGILDEGAVARKAQRLIAEAGTDEEGKFTFELDAKTGYEGEAFEVDVYCATIPHRKHTRKPPEPLQLSITTLQPEWRQTEEGYTAFWEYCLPSRFWCAVRARFGAWTICGRVMDCKAQVPVAGVTVHAYDADWSQDDRLDSDSEPAITDGTGKFRIDYLRSDFEKTPFPLVNIEWVGGPDLYFMAESGGSMLLQESRSRGREPDRENSGPCVCVTLCVEAPTPPVNNPWFTHIGDFHIYGDLDSTTGLTNKAFAGHGGPAYGFFGAMKLKGFCPKTSPSGAPNPMRYRFLYQRASDPNPVPITGTSLVAPVVVGSRLIQWKIFDNSFVWTFQSIVVAGSGATPDPTPQPPGAGPWGAPPAHVIVPDSEGWIAVDPNALDNGFYGPLIRFNTMAAVPGGAAPDDGAGQPVSNPENGVGIKLIFEAGPAGGAASFSNEVDNVHVNNWNEVRLLDIQQFHEGGGTPCSPLSSQLDVLYTVDHELLAEWNLSITSASPSAPGQVEGGMAPRGGFGTYHENISAWQSCSYKVWLSTRRALTDGETDDPANSELLTFCK